jgi:ATP-dependent protease ClpP protease subunit
MSWRNLGRIAAFSFTAVGAYGIFTYASKEVKSLRINAHNKLMRDIWKDICDNNPKKYNEHAIIFEIKDKKYDFLEKIFNDESHSYINMNMAMNIVRNLKTISIKLKEENKTKYDIIIFIDTCGGEVGSVKMICDAIKTFKKQFDGKLIVIIPEKALSAGTIIALSADEIMMNDYSLISKIDPQLMGVATKHFESNNDKNLLSNVLYGHVRDCNGTINAIINQHIKPQYEPDVFKNIMDELLLSESLHENTYNKEEFEKMGLNVTLIPYKLNNKLTQLIHTKAD